jgi:hypothetical protein
VFFLGSVLANVSQAQSVPVTGQNVNMVAGIGRTRNADGTYSYSLGDGDPFLTKQNDPSIAVSSLNPLHLLGGANDYRLIPLAQSVVVPKGRVRTRGSVSIAPSTEKKLAQHSAITGPLSLASQACVRLHCGLLSPS